MSETVRILENIHKIICQHPLKNSQDGKAISEALAFVEALHSQASQSLPSVNSSEIQKVQEDKAEKKTKNKKAE